MAGISGWELRNRVKGQGPELSHKQLEAYRSWGILPELPEGGWTEQDVEKVKKLHALGPDLRVHRRIIRLRNIVDFVVPPEKLREAMLATVPEMLRGSPVRYARHIYWATLVQRPRPPVVDGVRIGGMTLDEAKKRPFPVELHPPGTRVEWERVLRRFDPGDFDLLAGQSYTRAYQLQHDPNVRASGLLDDIPLEELVIHLLTWQLRIDERPEHKRWVEQLSAE